MKCTLLIVLVCTFFCAPSFGQVELDVPHIDLDSIQSTRDGLGHLHQNAGTFDADHGKFILNTEEFRERFRIGENGSRQDSHLGNGRSTSNVPQHSLILDILANEHLFLEELDAELRKNTRLAAKLGITLEEFNYSYAAQLVDIAGLPGNDKLLSVLNLAKDESVLALATKYGSERNERGAFLWNLAQVLMEQEISNFHSEQSLETELRRRGFLRGEDYMIFDGDDIHTAQGLILTSGSGDNTAVASSPALTQTGERPDLPGLVRARSATGFLIAVNRDIVEIQQEDGKLIFSNILTYGDVGGVIPLCDNDKASEPAFGLCTGVFFEVSTPADNVFVTARHCLKGIMDAGVPAFVLFDYDGDTYSVEQRILTSEIYARVNRNTIKSHPFLDIGWAELDFEELTPVLPISAAAEEDLTVGKPVGSYGHPAGRPKKAIFGSRVTVAWIDEHKFGAYVDNFARSSGSPIVTYGGEALGILVEQEEIVDYVEVSSPSGAICRREAIVSSALRRPPSMVKIWEVHK